MRDCTRWHVIIATLTLALLSACGDTQRPEPTIPFPRDHANTLHRGNGVEPQTLDPHKAEGVPSSNILRDLFEGLTATAQDGGVEPAAAQSWTISDDGRVYTFKLRQTARWSNGDPVTAQDFVFGLRRSVAPATGSKYAQTLAPILNAEAIIAGDKPPEALGAQALGPHTLEITLKGPTPYFLGLLTHSTTYPVHRASLERFGDEFAKPGTLVSNGAYRLVEWVMQSHVRTVRNTHYWDNANTSIDQVFFYALENQATEAMRFRIGDLDMTYEVPVAQVPWLRKHLDEYYTVHTYLGTYYYGFNVTRAPFKDAPELREALSLAIDRDVIVEKTMQNAGEQAAYGWVPPAVPGYETQVLPYAELTQAQRNERARALYRKAGYSEQNPLEVEIRYNTNQNHKRVAIAIAGMWRETLGARVKMVNEEWKVFLANRKAKQVTEVFRAGWIGDYNDPKTFLELLHSNHGINDSGYSNPQYDALLERAATTVDPQERLRILAEAERLMLAEHPVTPIYYYVTKRLVSPRVGNFRGNIMDHHYTKNLYLTDVPAQTAALR